VNQLSGGKLGITGASTLTGTNLVVSTTARCQSDVEAITDCGCRSSSTAGQAVQINGSNSADVQQ
jgi:hypothetical protein